MKSIRFVSVLVLAVTACGDGTTSARHESAEYSMPVSSAGAPATAMDRAGQSAPASVAATRTAAADTGTVAPAMLIRTGTASVEVDSVEAAVARVQRLAVQLGGYVGSTSITGGAEEARAATLELKVPTARFDQAVGGLRPIGRVESVQVQAQDVSEEFVDLSARTANARRLEERLLGLLATRTGKLEDVLAVERELARVRQEIEVQEGRLRYLRTRVAVSTLTVTLHEPAPVIGDYPGSSPIGEAFRNAWRNFVQFMAALIESLGVLIPSALLLAGFVWLLRRFWRASRPRRPEPPSDGR
jgi:hypothetical protein